MTPTQFLEAWMENVWNKRSTQFIYDHLAQPCSIEGLPESTQNPAGFAAFRDNLIAAIPDMQVTIEEAVENGEKVAGVCRVTGTHSASERKVDFCFGYTAQVQNDQIVSARNVVDFLTMLQQTESISQDSLEKALTS